jgi:amino acid transporter
MFAPRAIRRYLSFENGWLCVIGWQSAITGIAMLAAGAIQGLIALTHPEYSWARWHGSLLTIAIVFFASAVNIFAANLVPNIEGIVVVVRIIGILADLIVLWVLAPKNNSYDAFLQFRNDSGWHSIAMAVMSALQYQVVSLLGFDSLTHMCRSSSGN